MGKTHYAHVDRANESDINDYWSETACGLEYTESELTNNPKHVTCKNCLRVMAKAKTKSDATPITYDALLYAGLLEKFIAHIVWHEGITYTTNNKLKDSDVEFTEDDVKILQDIASRV